MTPCANTEIFLNCFPTLQKNLNPAFELRSYQVQAFKNFVTHFENKNTPHPLQVLFHMATGNGKTLIDPAIQKAFKAENIFTQDEINLRRYELREKNQRDRFAEINCAIKEALKEERKKYIQEEENRVVRLIKKGKSLDNIMDFTSLSKERVQQLFDENRNGF